MIVQNGIVYDEKSMGDLVTQKEKQECQNNMAKEIKNLREGISKDIKIALSEFKDDLDNRYADKTIEKIVYSTLVVSVTSLIGFLIQVIFWLLNK